MEPKTQKLLKGWKQLLPMCWLVKEPISFGLFLDYLKKDWERNKKECTGCIKKDDERIRHRFPGRHCSDI